MTQYITEAKRFQKLAGIINEAEAETLSSFKTSEVIGLAQKIAASVEV
jgi:hypothetical protein